MLRAQNITFTNPDGFCLEADIQFDIGWHVILGGNGSGKSSLLRLLAGAVKPDSGLVSYQGSSIYSNVAYYQNLGYLPQDFQAYPKMTAKKFLEYVGRLKLIPAGLLASRIGQLMTDLNLGDWAETSTRKLSKGVRQRLGLAQALLADPKILILDEPTQGMDPQERLAFLELLGRLAANRVILQGSNHPEEANNSDTVTVLMDGKVLAAGRVSVFLNQLRGQIWQTHQLVEGALVLEQVQTESGWKYIIATNQPPGTALAFNPGLEHWYRWIKLTSQ